MELPGLSPEEAAERLRRFGPNQLRPKRERALVLQFLARFRNPLVIVLLVSASVAAALGDVRSLVVIASIVLMSVTLDFVQEHRAERAAEALRRSVETRATVRRSGKTIEIAAREVVPGDVVQLCAGDLVPADAKLVEARDLFVNQALLTGEPYPVEKRPEKEAADEAEPSSAAHVFMGSSVVSGTATCTVVKTGAATAVGETAHLVESKPPAREFERGTREFGLLIARMTAMLVAFVVVVSWILRRPPLESFLFAVALAVGLTPELLPMIVSVTLARGAMRMAERRVIVKRLSAVQNLGSMDVLCTDKTGTLTEARIELAAHVDARGHESERVLELAWINSAFETGVKSPLDEAILARGGERDRSAFRKIDEVPFDFERRRVSILVERDGKRLLAVKGAYEDVLRLSTEEEIEGVRTPLDDDARAAVVAQARALGAEGYRLLGVAYREVELTRDHAVVDDESALVFAGFCAFRDPPKKGAEGAIAALRSRGVTVKVVTGDDELVAQHVCRELGLPAEDVLTGAEIRVMNDDALRIRAEQATLFCRVTPVQKTRVLLALKSRGHVVGFLGDGINDAPSLHAADVGISVDSAVDVAKEAADLILLDRDLRVLYDGVLEGRRTFGNVLKYVMMGTSSNFGNMFSMAAAAAILPFLPLLPIQVLLNNLLYDLSEISIPLDDVDEEFLARPHRWEVGFVRRFMVIVGPVSSVFDGITFAVLLLVLHADAALFRTGWFVESLASQVLVIFVIRTRGSPFSSRPARALTVTSLLVVGVAVALPFTPFGRLLGFVAPPPIWFAILPVLLFAYLAMVEGVKRIFYRTIAKQA